MLCWQAVTDDDGPNDPSLQWYIDDAPVEDATTEDVEVILTETGEYVVRLTAFEGVATGLRRL